MKKIVEVINCKTIQLENVKVKFTVKLLQYHLNEIIYKYNQKFAFKEYCLAFNKELVDLVLNSGVHEDGDAKELVCKVRGVINYVRVYVRDYAPSLHELNDAIDKSIRFILFQYSNNKVGMRMCDVFGMLQEVRLVDGIVRGNNLLVTDRVKNLRMLEKQLKERICDEL